MSNGESGDGDTGIDFVSMVDSLPDDIKSNEQVRSHKDFGSFAKAFVHAQSMIGRDKIVLPKEGDSEDVWDRYREGLGIPSDPSGYSRDPLGEAFADSVVDGLTRQAMEAGVPASAWEKMAPAIAGAKLAERQDAIARAQEKLEPLRREWGDKWDTQLDLAERAGEFIYQDEFADLAQETLSDGTPLSMHPTWLKALARIGEEAGDPSLDAPNSLGGTGRMSKEEAESKIKSMWGDEDKKKALLDATHPQHDEIVAEKNRLAQIAYAED